MRSKEIKKPTWEEIYKHWKYVCEDLFSPITNTVSIVDIPVKSCSYITNNSPMVIDWWPISEIEKRKKEIEDDQSRIIGFGLNKGTKHTMELLYELRDNPEGIAAVWIGVCLKDKEDNYPKAWRGEMAQIVDYTYGEVIRKLDKLNVYTWHHAMREAIPIDLFRGWTYMLGEDYRPASFESLMTWIALESVLTCTTWTIVRVYDKDKIIGFKRK